MIYTKTHPKGLKQVNITMYKHMYQIIKTYQEHIKGVKEERTFIEHLLYSQLVKIMVDKNISSEE